MENRVEADKPQCVHAAREAQAPSGCAHHHFEKATELLSDEHRVIERVLAVVEKLATNARGETRSTAGRRRSISFVTLRINATILRKSRFSFLPWKSAAYRETEVQSV